jgi:uncharacterized OsmC-like protein
MITTYKATAKKSKDGLQVETSARGFKILIDEPESLGGTNVGMSPVEVLLCALGACQTIVATAFAESQNFHFEEFNVELEGDLDPDGFMGLADVRNGFQEIRYKMHFKTNETQEKTEAFAQFIEKRCPVGDCLENGVKLISSGVIKD